MQMQRSGLDRRWGFKRDQRVGSSVLSSTATEKPPLFPLISSLPVSFFAFRSPGQSCGRGRRMIGRVGQQDGRLCLLRVVATGVAVIARGDSNGLFQADPLLVRCVEEGRARAGRYPEVWAGGQESAGSGQRWRSGRFGATCSPCSPRSPRSSTRVQASNEASDDVLCCALQRLFSSTLPAPTRYALRDLLSRVLPVDQLVSRVRGPGAESGLDDAPLDVVWPVGGCCWIVGGATAGMCALLCARRVP